MRVLDTLAEALAQERAERQRLAVENATLWERVGRAEALAASASALQVELDRLRARPTWRAWWPW